MSISPAESALLHLSPPPPSASLIVHSACAATHEDALTSPFAKSVFRATKDADGVRVGVVFPEAVDASGEEDLLALGVAALHAFA